MRVFDYPGLIEAIREAKGIGDSEITGPQIASSNEMLPTEALIGMLVIDSVTQILSAELSKSQVQGRRFPLVAGIY